MRFLNYFLCVFCFATLTVSCNDHKRTIHLRFKNGFALHDCDSVLLNGVTIGSRISTGLSKDYASILTIEIDEQYHLPIDSRFQVYQRDILSRALLVTPGKSKQMIKDGDTLQGLDFATIPESDSTGRIFLRELRKIIIAIDSTHESRRAN